MRTQAFIAIEGEEKIVQLVKRRPCTLDDMVEGDLELIGKC